MIRSTLLSLVLLCAMLTLQLSVFDQQTLAQPAIYPTDFIDLPGVTAGFIHPDILPDRYWAESYGTGLHLIAKENDEWSVSSYTLGDVRGFTGPDSQGRLYCSFGGNPAGVYVFDSTSEAVVDTISLNYFPRGLVLSPDESKLYVCAWEWPSLADGERLEGPGGTSPSDEHPDKGLVLEIDIATHAILRSVNVGTFPEAIHYAELSGGDRIVACTGQSRRYFWKGDPAIKAGHFQLLDIVDVDTFTLTEPRIEVASYGYFTDWPGEGSLIAFCTKNLITVKGGPENIWHAVKLVDPGTSQIVDTKKVLDATGGLAGVRGITPSSINPDEVYVMIGQPAYPRLEPYDWLIVIDKITGHYLRSIDYGSPGYGGGDVYEAPCGELIITAYDHPDSRIIIMEPENQIPYCNLLVVTSMPHLGDGVIEFDATESYDPDPCDEITFEWDFDGDLIFNEPIDDSYTGPDNNPTHTYTDDYIGPVFLRLTDSDGLGMMCTVEVQVFVL